MTILFRNASWSGIAAAFRAVAGLFNALLAVRLLGVENYGHVATLLSMFVLYLSLNSGIFTALVVKLMRPADDSVSHSDMLAASAIFSVISLVLLIVMTLLLSVLAPRLMSIDSGTQFDVEMRQVVLLMGVLSAIQIAVALHSAWIESVGRLDLAMKWQLVGPTVVLALLGVFFFARHPLSAADYIGVLGAGALTDLGMLWIVRSRMMSYSVLCWPTRQGLQGLGGLLRAGGLLQATSLMNMFLEPLNKLLLNHFVGAAAVTIYDLAMKVIWGIQYLFSATMRVFLHLGSQNEEAVGPAFTRVIALIGVPAIILHAIGVLFLSWIAHHWLHIGATQLMIFFSIATFSNLGMIFITPLYISLIGRGELQFIFRSQAILAITNIIVVLAIVPYFGVVGAGFGLLTATVYNVIAIYKRCKTDSTAFVEVGQLVRARPITLLLVGLLFTGAVLLGIRENGSDIYILLILIGLCVIAIREPLVTLFLARIRARA